MPPPGPSQPAVLAPASPAPASPVPAVAGPKSPVETWATELAPDPITDGKELFWKQGCDRCHRVDGTRLIGPSLLGLIGRTEEFVDGTSVVITKEYLFESITRPNARTVKGFPPAMPDYGKILKPEQLEALVAYLESL